MRPAEEVQRAADSAKVIKMPARRVTGMTLDRLLATDFPEPRFAVDGTIPAEGLTLVCGRPKLGKSWLVLDIGLSATTPGRKALGAYDCGQGDVLLLALEDNLGRLKSRLVKIGAKPSCSLDIQTEWPRGKDGLDAIRRWHDAHQATGKMVAVDTITRIRPQGIPNKDAYQADAQALEPLQQLALERGIAVVCVGHTRKAQSDDWLDSVIGTTGTTGTADAVLVLKRERGQADAVLYGTGRDLPDFERPLRFDEQSGRWSVLDMSAAEAKAGNFQSEIVALLRRMGCGLTIEQIASATSRSKQATFNALDRMEANGLVQKAGRNLWALPKGW
jgi:hypothetical protein